MPKICSKCGVEKELSEFNKKTGCKYGVSSRCRACDKEYKKQYALTHQDVIKKYRQEHAEEIAKKDREYRQSHKEQIRARTIIYNKEHEEHRRTVIQEWRKNHKEYLREYERNRIKTRNFEVLPRLRIRVNRRIWVEFKRQNIEQTLSAVELIGCSFPEFKKHIESLFTEGMSWDNYKRGGWQIDHIIPVSAFNLKDIEQQKKCFNYKNCQPLWEKENRAKSDYLPDGTRGRDIKK